MPPRKKSNTNSNTANPNKSDLKALSSSLTEIESSLTSLDKAARRRFSFASASGGLITGAALMFAGALFTSSLSQQQRLIDARVDLAGEKARADKAIEEKKEAVAESKELKSAYDELLATRPLRDRYGKGLASIKLATVSKTFASSVEVDTCRGGPCYRAIAKIIEGPGGGFLKVKLGGEGFSAGYMNGILPQGNEYPLFMDLRLEEGCWQAMMGRGIELRVDIEEVKYETVEIAIAAIKATSEHPDAIRVSRGCID